MTEKDQPIVQAIGLSLALDYAEAYAAIQIPPDDPVRRDALHKVRKILQKELEEEYERRRESHQNAGRNRG